MGTKLNLTPNGIEIVEQTAEDIAQRETDNTSSQAIIDAEIAKKNLKASAKAKLVAGEALTEDEANVMIGG